MGEDWGLREVGCPGGGRLTGMSEQNLLPAYLIVGTDGLKRQKALEKLRAYYPKANDEERAALRQEILSAEQRAETTELKIKQLEKEIRNAENEEILR